MDNNFVCFKNFRIKKFSIYLLKRCHSTLEEDTEDVDLAVQANAAFVNQEEADVQDVQDVQDVEAAVDVRAVADATDVATDAEDALEHSEAELQDLC
jgi:hypothetical protein